MVVVMATDPSGATDTVNVNITVTDEDDPAVITGKKAVPVAENDTAVASYSATDEDGDDIVWSLDGDDKAKFEISDAGVLTFKDAPNYEKAGDTGTDNIYKVTVKATGGTQAVEVTVTDVDEAGKVTLNQPQPQAGRTIKADGPGDPDKPLSPTISGSGPAPPPRTAPGRTSTRPPRTPAPPAPTTWAATSAPPSPTPTSTASPRPPPPYPKTPSKLGPSPTPRRPSATWTRRGLERTTIPIRITPRTSLL